LSETIFDRTGRESKCRGSAARVNEFETGAHGI
jgi:hypothetical protein